MLYATKSSRWKSRYDIARDGQHLATWDSSVWKTGGTLELEGQQYSIGGSLWGSSFGMARPDGTPLGTADHVGRKKWTVWSDGVGYEFRRASLWATDQDLYADGHRAGSVVRPSSWKSDAKADLPDLPLPIQVFVLVVVLAMWDRADVAMPAVG